jgi:hypothetical protein
MPYRHTETLVRQAEIHRLIQAVIELREFDNGSAMQIFVDSVESLVSDFAEFDLNYT